jgi:class 3 adenylate cyclase/tetratricopeptide (TPR) repeat protein
VLFADIKGSMELLATRDPEDARRLLDPILERMMEAVHRYEGTVNQVMGDGIMALFGAPLALEDHAIRACYAALRIQADISRHGTEMLRTVGVPIEFRVGLNSGEVVVRTVGSDLRMDYTAVGQTTHMAARMEQMAQPGSVFLTAETARLAEGYVQVKPLGLMPVKGLTDPIDVFELTDVGHARTRLQAAEARGLSRLVGREAELERLRHAFERAYVGRGHVTALVAEPGVGKSRLVLEVTQSHGSAGWLILEAASVSYGKDTPYLPLLELLRSYFEIRDGDGPPDMQRKVTGKLLSLDPALEGDSLPLLALLDVPVDAQAWTVLEPRSRHKWTLEALCRLFLCQARGRPLCLVFEDLHWIDAQTQAFLDTLVDRLPGAKLLLLVTYRPEYRHAWGSKTDFTQLRLDPLPAESAAALLRSLLGNDSRLADLTRHLIERTGGNAFFIEESVRSLVETGALSGRAGAYTLTRTLEAIRVPPTVQAVLAARVDRLDPEDKRLLQSAAVVGKNVPLTLLEAVAEVPEDILRQRLARLEAAELLYETGVSPDREYTFKHALTHEVTYAGLLGDRRRTLHAAILDTIERRFANRLAEQADRLAHHAVRAERWDQAVHYLRKAALRAAARMAYREAAAGYEHALAALRHLPDDAPRRREAIDVRLDLFSALMATADYGRLLDHLGRAAELAEGLADQRRLGRVLAGQCLTLRITGATEQAIDTGRRALAIAREVNDPMLFANTSFFLGTVHTTQGDFREAASCYRASFSPLDGELTRERALAIPPFAAGSRSWLALTLASLGEFSEGLSLAREAIEIAEAQGNRFIEASAVCLLASAHLIRGDFSQGTLLMERALSLCRLYEVRDWLAITTTGLGSAYVQAGRMEEGVALLEEGVAHAESIGQMTRHPTRLAQLASAYLRAGRRAEAEETARRGEALACELRQRADEPVCLRVLGIIAAAADPLEAATAEAYFIRACGLAAGLEMRPLVAHCHLDLGRLYARVGKRDEAREHLAVATTMYREMDMRFWLGQAEAEVRNLA